MRKLVMLAGLLAMTAIVLAGCTTVFCGYKKCQGTQGPDFIDGLFASDPKMLALGGCDGVFGANGNDKLYAGKGDDYAAGNVGDDTIYGDQGSDFLTDGNDSSLLYLLALVGVGGFGEAEPAGVPLPPDIDPQMPIEVFECIAESSILTAEQAEGLARPGATLPNGIPVEELGFEGGKDKFYGGSGRDAIDAVDGEQDFVDCGPGEDIAFVDEGLDKVVNCEEVAYFSPFSAGSDA